MLPAFAIVLAIGLAFATESDTPSQTAYYQHPILGVQSTTVGDECFFGSEFPCTYNGYQLYKEPELINDLRKDL